MQINPKKGGGAEVKLNKTDKKQLATAYELCERLAKFGRVKAAWKAFDALKVLLTEFGALPTPATEAELWEQAMGESDEKSPTA